MLPETPKKRTPVQSGPEEVLKKLEGSAVRTTKESKARPPSAKKLYEGWAKYLMKIAHLGSEHAPMEAERLRTVAVEVQTSVAALKPRCLPGTALSRENWRYEASLALGAIWRSMPKPNDDEPPRPA